MFVPILDSNTKNQYTCAVYFSFVKVITDLKFNVNYHMANFDIKSLFTNIP